jgi:CDP-abequose synthase
VRLLEAAIEHNCKAFINTDSYYSDIYQPHPLQYYNFSKRYFSEWGKNLSQNKIKFITLKLQHVYGPGDAKGKFCEFIVNECLANTQKIPVTDCLQVRDFIYVKDLISAYHKVILSYSDLANTVEFDVGTGKGHSLKDYIEIVKRVFCSSASFDYGSVKRMPGDLERSIANNQDLAKLGWTPKFSLEEGVTDMVKALCKGD